MFKEIYKHDNKQIKPSNELINETREEMKMINTERTPKRRFIARSIVSFATAAAVLTLAIFGVDLFTPENGGNGILGSGNSFTLQAFAMEQQEDGSVAPGSEWGITDGRIAVEFDDRLEAAHLGVQGIFSSPEVMGGDLLGLIISTGLGFRLDGENIVSATLTADQGFFQVIRIDNSTYWDIDRVNGTFELNNANLSSLLIWGYEYRYPTPIPETIRDGGDSTATTRALTEPNEPTTPNDRITSTSNKLPEIVVFTAIVTFEDGEEQVKSITFNPRDVWEAVGAQIENLPPPEQNPDGTWG